MKIVYVYDSIARIGGMERILTDKMNYLAEIYGHKVYLITSSQGNHPLSFPLSHKVEHIDLDTKFHLQYQHPLLEQLRVGWTLNHTNKKKKKKIRTKIKKRDQAHQSRYHIRKYQFQSGFDL